MRRVVLVIVALVSVSRIAWPQGNPLGPEFRVNTYTFAFQGYPSVAADSAGNFVVAWGSYLQDGSGWGLFGQRYDSSGVPLGLEFRVNAYTENHQRLPSVAADPFGNFVIVWTTGYPSWDVFGRRYSSSGATLGPEFRVNTYTTAVQSYPLVAVGPSGNFVVVWSSSDAQDGEHWGVFGQRYANSGAPLGPEFRVNTYTTNGQYGSDVAVDDFGEFVVVWVTGLGQDGSGLGVFGQLYTNSGAPLGPEFRVNTYTTGGQRSASVAKAAVGNFVVTWASYAQDGSPQYGVFGQRYSSSGTAVGPEFRVNTFTTSSQDAPSVAFDSSGNFVVVWGSYANPEDGDGAVFGQRYASSGASLGPEFRVNTYTTAGQFVAFGLRSRSVAAGSSGNFVVVWTSVNQDGSSFGVFGQRYGQIVPVELVQFRVE